MLLEEGDGLGMAVFGDLEVFLVQAFYGLAVVTGHDHVEHDGADIGFEDESAVGVGDGGLGVKRRRGKARKGARRRRRGRVNRER